MTPDTAVPRVLWVCPVCPSYILRDRPDRPVSATVLEAAIEAHERYRHGL